MSIFQAEMGFWIGMGATAAATVAYILVCWLLPPKARKRNRVRR